MAIDPVSFGMLFSTGMEAWQTYEAGNTAKAQYDADRREIANETAYAQRMALEKQKDIHAEGRSAASRVRASAGKSGLAVGGSVATLSEAITRKVERQKAMVSLEFGEIARSNEYLQKKLKYKGQVAKYEARLGMYESLLTGGMKLAKRKEGLKNPETGESVGWGGLFFKDRR